MRALESKFILAFSWANAMIVTDKIKEPFKSKAIFSNYARRTTKKWKKSFGSNGIIKN